MNYKDIIAAGLEEGCDKDHKSKKPETKEEDDVKNPEKNDDSVTEANKFDKKILKDVVNSIYGDARDLFPFFKKNGKKSDIEKFFKNADEDELEDMPDEIAGHAKYNWTDGMNDRKAEKALQDFEGYIMTAVDDLY